MTEADIWDSRSCEQNSQLGERHHLRRFLLSGVVRQLFQCVWITMINQTINMMGRQSGDLDGVDRSEQSLIYIIYKVVKGRRIRPQLRRGKK